MLLPFNMRSLMCLQVNNYIHITILEIYRKILAFIAFFKKASPHLSPKAINDLIALVSPFALITLVGKLTNNKLVLILTKGSICLME